MPQIQFELTDFEDKVLATSMASVQDWLENLCTWQARLVMDSVVDTEIQSLLADPTVQTIPSNRNEIFRSAMAKGGFV